MQYIEEVKINRRLISPTGPSYCVADIGYMENMEHAKSLIDAAREARAEAVTIRFSDKQVGFTQSSKNTILGAAGYGQVDVCVVTRTSDEADSYQPYFPAFQIEADATGNLALLEDIATRFKPTILTVHPNTSIKDVELSADIFFKLGVQPIIMLELREPYSTTDLEIINVLKKTRAEMVFGVHDCTPGYENTLSAIRHGVRYVVKELRLDEALDPLETFLGPKSWTEMVSRILELEKELGVDRLIAKPDLTEA